MSLLDEVLELRLQVLKRYPETVLDDGGTELLRGTFQKHLDGAKKIKTLSDSSGLRGVVALGAPQPAMLGLDNTHCHLDFRQGDLEAQAWGADMLCDWIPRLDDSFVLMLDPVYRSLLPTVTQAGLRVQALLLHGRPEEALRAIGGPPNRERLLDEGGLSIEPLSSSEQVEHLVRLRHRYFTTHPQHSPMSTQRQIDESQQAQINEFVRKKLLKSVQTKSDTQFVVLQGTEVMGGFGLILHEHNPTLGFCAGVEIFLDPSVHGRGVGTLAYRILLQRMIELGVRVFKGTTANPAVIHLARKMKRRLRGWKLVPGSCPEIPEYFDYPLT
ncbi:GNAT family N-acetyltransferase [Acidobacteriota bacterium]